MSRCTTRPEPCPHGKTVYIWVTDGPWLDDPADPDYGGYPWVHNTTMTPGHMVVCDQMPFATPEEAGEPRRTAHQAAITDLVLDLFAGPGGWTLAAAALGILELGIELDAAACATRAAAGHRTVRADVAGLSAEAFAGRLAGLIASPPCIVFSAAGKRAGVSVTAILADAIRDVFAGRKTRAGRRREMARSLRLAWWPNPKLTREQRSAAIWKAVRSASLVIEPARFIYECRPEWVALEQVPAVLPLWEVYADELRKLGYSVWTGKVNAADYGVPQTRERAILIASRVRRVSRPEPTHYNPRKGMQLWGEPWVTMADALGWGADGRPAVTVTAGGTGSGGAEPFGNRGRAALEAERNAGRWTLRTSFGNPWTGPKRTGTGSHGTHEMNPATRPSHTVTTKAKDWVMTRPATTVQGDPRIGESQFAQDSVRITVAEAALLQSFPAAYPWRGTRTQQHTQVGNAWCPLAAIAVLGVATGVDWQPVAEQYAKAVYGIAEAA